MNYELAKQLKDAGYPQAKSLWVISPTGNIRPTPALRPSVDENEIACPTLSELIEACGDGFRQLGATNGMYWTIGWLDDDSISTEGSNLEDAVMNLWLALNKK